MTSSRTDGPSSTDPAVGEPGGLPPAAKGRRGAAHPGSAVTGFSAVDPAEPVPLPPAVAAQIQGNAVVNGLVAAAIIIAGLYYGRELLMPLALAILLGFVLDPVVTRLKRWGLPRAAAVAVVILVTFGLAAGIGGFVVNHLRTLAADLPVYQSNVMHKIHSFQQSLHEPGLFDQWRRMFGRVESELNRAGPEPIDEGAAAANRARGSGDELTRVQVVPAPPSPVQQAVNWIESISAPLVTAGIVLLFVCLILLDRGDLRDRLLRLLGGNLHRTTDALNEAGRRVSRYLTMQLVVNVAYGLPMALGLWLIGVPGALLWGLLAAVLRFVPILGPMIAAVFPVTLAFATDPGWGMVMWTVGLIVGLELISNNVIEPWLYGSSTGLSALSIILSMTFWTAIWGPVGLVLSVPITVTLLVLGRHLPPLQFFDVLLGSEPVLDPPTRLYQRLLAGDFEEATELAVEVADETSPQTFYDTVGIPTLRLATEAHATVATAEHRHRLVSGMEQVITDLREDFPPEPGLPPEVICFGSRWQVDVLAADMVAHSLALAGHPARVAPPGNVSPSWLGRLDLEGAPVACLAYFSPDPTTHARYFIRRLRQRWPGLKIIVAAWNLPAGTSEREVARQIGADAVATTIEEVQAHVIAMTAEGGEPAYLPAPVPEDDEARVAAIRDADLLDEGLRVGWDAFAKRAAHAFDCTIAQVVIVDDEVRSVMGDSRGSDSVPRTPDGAPIGSPWAATMPREESICAHVVAAAETVVVPDLSRDPRFAANPRLGRRGARFYAGAPLVLKGRVLGVLCLFDSHPRSLTARDGMLLESMATEVVAMALGRDEAAADAEAAARATAAGTAATPPLGEHNPGAATGVTASNLSPDARNEAAAPADTAKREPDGEQAASDDRESGGERGPSAGDPGANGGSEQDPAAKRRPFADGG